MMLELKRLAPYLPYDINVTNGFEKVTLCLTRADDLKFAPEFKLILRPLSDLTKEELMQAGFNTHVDYLTTELQHELSLPKNKRQKDFYGDPIWDVFKAPYRMVEYLFSKHYDVFGLIPQGSAIDINTL